MWSFLSIFSLISGRVWRYVFIGTAILAVLSAVYLKGRSDCGASVKLASYRAQIAALKAANESLRKDASQALVDADEMAALERKIDELQDFITDGDCFTEPESERLRQLWGTDKR